MVIDRTQSDVNYAKSLREKIALKTATAEEITEYMQGALKGMYNLSDLNRVEGKVLEISETLIAYGYNNTVDVKFWEINDIFTTDNTTRILNNVQTLIDSYYTMTGTPTVPTKWLDYEGANDIEKILVEIETLINNMLNAMPRLAFRLGGIIR